MLNNLRDKRIGESRMQKCGQAATIIDYTGALNITVRFEDGTVVKKKQYGNFLKGTIGNPSVVGSRTYARVNGVSRIGESVMQKCGQKATIVEYKDYHNIAICFEDGTVVQGRSYKVFLKGEIYNPCLYGERIGESRMQRCGQMATIVECPNSRNITVKFDDGTLVSGLQYNNFLKGVIGNPNAKGTYAYARKHGKNRIGESRMMNCGQIATIIKYENSHNIAVCFEDGTVVDGRTYRHFSEGAICNPNAYKK